MLRQAKLWVGGLLAVAMAAGLTLPSCGVMSIGDCNDKATCSAPDATDAALVEDASGERGDDSTDESVTPDGDASVADEDVAVDDCPLSCAVTPTGGWLGPVALWEGNPDAGAPPPCPPGYDTPMDWTGDLIAPPRTCSCVCSASGEQCPLTTGKFGADTMCNQPCSTLSIPTTCAALPMDGGACGVNFSFNADKPTPSGGTCTGLVSGSSPVKPIWSTAARTCTLMATDASGGCSAPNAQCVPTPTAPYGTRTCVYQIVPVGDNRPQRCPTGFAPTPIVLYAPGSPIAESRDCSMCICNGPSGGSCTGTIEIFGGTTCSGTPAAYTLGSGCKTESLMGSPMPSHVQGSYVLSPGACTLTTDTAPIGVAQPSGPATVVCCM